jgi:uncharacterized protein YecE (DUF72 family)
MESPISRTKHLTARDERRAQQRAQNASRAAAMRESRLKWESATPLFTPQAGERCASQFYVGCSGWFYWHWRGGFYPTDLPTTEWFSYYTEHFNTVELNAPFYSWPTLSTVRSWLRQLKRQDFVYTVKVCELITHTKRFARTGSFIQDFGHIADLLGPRMGCFLFQLPPSFRYSPDRLRSILSKLDPRRRNVVEFRHSSWWNERVFEAFRASGVIFCSCSGPRLPDKLVKTADDVYLRFHGIKQWYRHNYTPSELSVWADRIRASGAVRTWAYFNNDRDGYATVNAKALLTKLQVSESEIGQ